MQNLASIVALTELLDSNDEQETRGKTRRWVKKRKERGYVTNIIQELMMESFGKFSAWMLEILSSFYAEFRI